MDDVVIGTVQARATQQAVRCAGIGPAELWWEYFQLGGAAGELEIDAYLHGCLRLPRIHRDLLAHAVNRLAHAAAAPRVPFSDELVRLREDARRGGRDRAPEHGG